MSCKNNDDSNTPPTNISPSIEDLGPLPTQVTNIPFGKDNYQKITFNATSKMYSSKLNGDPVFDIHRNVSAIPWQIFNGTKWGGFTGVKTEYQIFKNNSNTRFYLLKANEDSFLKTEINIFDQTIFYKYSIYNIYGEISDENVITGDVVESGVKMHLGTYYDVLIGNEDLTACKTHIGFRWIGAPLTKDFVYDQLTLEFGQGTLFDDSENSVFVNVYSKNIPIGMLICSPVVELKPYLDGIIDNYYFYYDFLVDRLIKL